MPGQNQIESPPPPPGLTGDPPLIFDWRRVRWRRARLTLALVIAAIGHVLVFYLFQVVTESDSRQAPPVREALILPASSAPTGKLLEGLADRLPALAARDPLASPDHEALDLLVKGYVPTWQDHRPALKPLPGKNGAGPLPPLSPAPSLLLPPLSPAPAVAEEAPRPKGPASRSTPVLGFQSGLTGRALVRGPQWPPAVLAEEWPDQGTASFLMSVSPAGKVTSCLSLGTSSGLDEIVLRDVLLKLKFAPRDDSDEPEWGWVDVWW